MMKPNTKLERLVENIYLRLYNYNIFEETEEEFYPYPTTTVDEINNELKKIGSNYRLDFDYLIEKKPYNERRGIMRTDQKPNSFAWLDSDYLNGATPDLIQIWTRDNPFVRVINGEFKYVLNLTSLFNRINKVKKGEAEDIYTEGGFQ